MQATGHLVAWELCPLHRSPLSGDTYAANMPLKALQGRLSA